MFATIQKYEKGAIHTHETKLEEILLHPTHRMIAFSCLSGDANELPRNLGRFFDSGKDKSLEKMFGYVPLSVIIDDTDPVRIWGSNLPQQEITEWLRMMIEDQRPQIPPSTTVELWSDIENRTMIRFEEVIEEIKKPKHALLVHHRMEHMKRRPPRRLVGSIKEASVRRVAQFALQGLIFETEMPLGILIQTDSPWRVKDPPYQALRKCILPIIHPFPEIQ